VPLWAFLYRLTPCFYHFYKCYPKHKTVNPKLAYICFMEVTNEMVEKIANLARLHIPAHQKETVKKELQQMISFVDKLNELDTTGVQPLMHMSENVNVVREDEVKGSITTAEALQNSPADNDSFFMVPKVIKKG
jgi:aspartyl-tRNA(Asn)/glutamyl-tRNA(Gln) amidotransferase subunit C